MSFAHQLNSRKTELEDEIAKLEDKARPLNARIAELRAQLGHIKALLPQNGDQPNGLQTIAPRLVSHQSRPVANDRFTPVEYFWMPILETLVDLGGSGRYERVIDRVGEKMEHILTPADKEILPSGMYVRWRNRVAWQRYNMVKQGLLRKDSPRGVWEITPEGNAWLGAARKLLVPKGAPNERPHQQQ